MKGLKQHMKNLKINLLFLIFAIFHLNPVFGQDFSIELVKSAEDKKHVIDTLGLKNKDDEVVKNQIVLIKDKNNIFYIAPVISTVEKNGGCYLQSLGGSYKLGARYLIEGNIDAQSCDNVIAIFGCHLPQKNGLGVIVGLRIGFDNYYMQGSYFDIVENNQLKNNDSLSQKIGSIESVAKAKKRLGCLK